MEGKSGKIYSYKKSKGEILLLHQGEKKSIILIRGQSSQQIKINFFLQMNESRKKESKSKTMRFSSGF